MSVSKNPDFWRSQESGGSEPAQPSASNAEKTPNTPKESLDPSGSQATPTANEPSLTEGGQQAQATARLSQKIQSSGSGYEGRSVFISDSKGGRRSADAAPSNTSPSTAKKPGTSPASGQNNAAQNRPGGGPTAPAGRGTSPAGAGRGTPPPKNAGSGVTPSASSGMADRLRGGGTAPKKAAASSNGASGKTGGDAPKVLSKETGKAAAGEALKQGIKGAAKGAVTGGLTGAAAGGAAGAVAGAADKVNESAARQPAGTTRGPSNKGGLFDSMGESALDKGRASLQGRYGSKSGAAGNAGGKLPLTPEQAESVAKAALTLQKEVTTTVVKKAGMAVGVVIALIYVLVMTMITAVTGPITAATTAYSAQSASCNDPSSSGGSSSPSPSPSPSDSAASAASAGNDSGYNLASNVNILAQGPVGMDAIADMNSNPSKYNLSPDADVRSQQIANAKTIIGVAKNIGFNQPGALIGVLTAMTESTLVNINRGDGAINPDGTVATSVGLFQQQYSLGWGTREEIMNPAYAAQAFFLGVNGKANPGLDSVAGWQTMAPGAAAQQVQRSGPNAYMKYITQATELTNALYAISDPVPSVTTGKINPPKAGVNIQTSASGCNASTSGGDSSTALGDTYPARNESYCRTSLCYAIQSVDGVASGYRGECVDWAGWKLIDATGTYGSYLPIGMGDAKDWGAGALAHGIAVDMKPRAGDAIYWAAGQGGSGSSGHIGTVQSVKGSKVTIEEYNYGTSLPGDTPATGGGRYHTRTIDATNATGYIHFIDPSKSKDENKQYLIDHGILVPGHNHWPRP